jgi:hypothetical protein
MAATEERTHPDARRQKLRGMMNTLDRELTGLASDGGADARVTALRGAWKALTAELNLGPEPETQTCPTCGALAMGQATRCMECWSKLRDAT